MALFDTNSGLGGLLGNLGDYGFGLPSNTGGLIADEDRNAINKRALLSGLISAGLTYAATPKNLNTGSIIPYLGKAGLAGFNTSQDVVDRSLNTAYRNKILTGRDDGFSNINPLDVTPESLKLYIEGGKKDPSVLRKAASVEKPLDIERLISIKDKLTAENPNNPNIPIYDDLIQNLRVKKEGLNINLNQPIPVINPKTGKAELVQFPNKPGEKPLFTGLEKAEPEARLKPIPSGPATAYAENNAAMKAVDDAIAKVEKAGENTFGLKNYLPGAVTQRIDRAGIDARSAVSAIGSKKYHDISGAAVTISEAPRMAPFIPSSSDTKEKILQNLRNIKTQYEDTNNSLSSVYNEDQGYRSLNVSPKVLNKPTEKNQPQNTLPATQQNRAYIGNRAIIVKGNKWVYEDTGEVAQ